MGETKEIYTFTTSEKTNQKQPWTTTRSLPLPRRKRDSEPEGGSGSSSGSFRCVGFAHLKAFEDDHCCDCFLSLSLTFSQAMSALRNKNSMSLVSLTERDGPGEQRRSTKQSKEKAMSCSSGRRPSLNALENALVFTSSSSSLTRVLRTRRAWQRAIVCSCAQQNSREEKERARKDEERKRSLSFFFRSKC